MNRPGEEIIGKTILIEAAQPREGWTTFQFKLVGFRDYADVTSSTDDWLDTPKFSYEGDEWLLRICPGGDSNVDDGYLSVFIAYTAIKGRKSALKFEVQILDKSGRKRKKKKHATLQKDVFENTDNFPVRGFTKLMLLSDILDESQNILDEFGSITIAVSMKDTPSTAFVPKNPFQDIVQNKFLDEETSDVCFEVSTAEPNEDNTVRARRTIQFHAHRFILNMCAPMLAELFGEESTAVSVNDIKPDVFQQLLWYVYGGNVPKAPLKEYAKDIIDAADKYSIVNLKLEAEAAYVKSTRITAANVMDNLLYADAKNLALLKETVMDFLVANGTEVIGNVSFANFPPQLVNDLLVATTRSRNEGDNGNDNDFTTMRVSELRKKLHEKGLGMSLDGSRETMIEALRNSAAEN